MEPTILLYANCTYYLVSPIYDEQDNMFWLTSEWVIPKTSKTDKICPLKDIELYNL